jgi:hypothetical protein
MTVYRCVSPEKQAPTGGVALPWFSATEFLRMGNDGTHFIAIHNDAAHSNKGWVAVQLPKGVFALKAWIFLEREKLKKNNFLSL